MPAQNLAPVDIERQCGVVKEGGVPCTRSVTCKAHSMHAKRAVPGRSAPFDQILDAYMERKEEEKRRAEMAVEGHGDAVNTEI